MLWFVCLMYIVDLFGVSFRVVVVCILVFGVGVVVVVGFGWFGYLVGFGLRVLVVFCSILGWLFVALRFGLLWWV